MEFEISTNGRNNLSCNYENFFFLKQNDYCQKLSKFGQKLVKNYPNLSKSIQIYQNESHRWPPESVVFATKNVGGNVTDIRRNL